MRPGKSRDPVNRGTVNRGFTVVHSYYATEQAITLSAFHNHSHHFIIIHMYCMMQFEFYILLYLAAVSSASSFTLSSIVRSPIITNFPGKMNCNSNISR